MTIRVHPSGGAAMIKILHKAITMLVSVLIGKVTTALFRKAWQASAHQDEVPKATDAQRRWGEVLLAAALEGMIIALVKAAVDRAAAEGINKLTGVWPGENRDREEGQQQPAELAWCADRRNSRSPTGWLRDQPMTVDIATRPTLAGMVTDTSRNRPAAQSDVAPLRGRSARN
jgi:hypothetical protein